MSRERKLTKYSILNALRKHKTIVETARELGVNRSTLYASMKHFGVAKPSLSDSNPTYSGTYTVPSQSITEPLASPAAVPEPPVAPSKPAPDARCLTISDFSGRHCGDVSSRPRRKYY